MVFNGESIYWIIMKVSKFYVLIMNCFILPYEFKFLIFNWNAIVLGEFIQKIQYAGTAVLCTQYNPAADVRQSAGSSWLSVHIHAGSWGWSYEEQNFLSSTRQANNDPSNDTLFFLFLFLPWKHEAEGAVVVVARFHAASSCLQLSSLYWRLALKITSMFLVLWSKFFELSEGLIYLRFRK